MENNYDNRVEDEVNKTLNILGEMQHPTANDDFFERLQERIDTSENDNNVKPLFTMRRMIAAAAAVALIVVNGATVYKIFNERSQSENQARESQIENLIEDYSLDYSDPYNV